MSLNLSLLILHVADRLHMEQLPKFRGPPIPPRIAIGTLNIRDGKGFGLSQSIRAV